MVLGLTSALYNRTTMSFILLVSRLKRLWPLQTVLFGRLLRLFFHRSLRPSVGIHTSQVQQCTFFHKVFPLTGLHSLRRLFMSIFLSLLTSSLNDYIPGTFIVRRHLSFNGPYLIPNKVTSGTHSLQLMCFLRVNWVRYRTCLVVCKSTGM